MARFIYNVENSISLTSDIWTDPMLRSFICCTGSYIDSDWRMHSTLINIHNCTERHTGDNLWSGWLGSWIAWWLMYDSRWIHWNFQCFVHLSIFPSLNSWCVLLWFSGAMCHPVLLINEETLEMGVSKAVITKNLCFCHRYIRIICLLLRLVLATISFSSGHYVHIDWTCSVNAGLECREFAGLWEKSHNLIKTIRQSRVLQDALWQTQVYYLIYLPAVQVLVVSLFVPGFRPLLCWVERQWWNNWFLNSRWANSLAK